MAKKKKVQKDKQPSTKLSILSEPYGYSRNVLCALRECWRYQRGNQ